MNQEIKTFIIILVLFLIIDVPMITKINYGMYEKQFLRINNDKKVNNVYFSASIAYICLVIGLYTFVIRGNVDLPLVDVAIKGGLFGFVIYGIYNATNKATIAEFGTEEAIKDTVWGIILCALISVGTIYIIRLNPPS